MEITRRSLLGASAAVGAGLLLPLNLKTVANAAVPPGLTPFTTALPTLAELGTINATAGGEFAITMVNASHSFHTPPPGTTQFPNTPTFAYQGGGLSQTYLGPVIVAKRGQSFNLDVTNSITSHPLATAIDDALDGVVPGPTGDRATPRTSTHLHGGNTPPQFDGDPMDTFTTSKTYTYGNTQESAGLWYHDHAVGITRLNVFAGLASGYLIRDANDPGDGALRTDGSALPPQPYEVPLIIQDRQFNNNGTFDYPPNLNPTTPRAWAPEFFGDVATVNGAIWPNLNVAAGKYRFRVYNGSNARFYNFRFVSGRKNNALTFFQIGTDGGLLDASVPLNQLLLAPGERADLVVDFAGLPLASTVVLTNDAVTPFPNGPRKFKKGGAPLPQIMQFTVSAGPGWQTPLPAVLRQPIGTGDSTGLITRLAGKPLARTRSMSLVEILDAAGAPVMALLNNRTFNNSDSITYTPPVNNLVTNNPPILSDTLEQWDLINTTGDAHPIHLHFTQFQVLNRQAFNAKAYVAAAYGPPPLVQNTGNYLPPPVTQYLKGGPTAPPANEQGWKDTVTAMPGEVTRILVPFGANAVPGSPMAIGASHTGDYVWHCHILEHEDNDMMQRYVIQ